MKPSLLVDARCLQHPDFARRGIGLHLASMLAAPQAREFGISLLLDPGLPLPTPDVAALCEAVTTTTYEFARQGGVLLQPAPLSFAPGRILGLLRAPLVRSVAVVLDFIPLDLPGLYLQSAAARRGYAAGLAALRRYDGFLPISAATERRLHGVIPSSVGRSTVTGVAMRPGLLRDAGSPGFAGRAGIVVVAGDDPRKNPDIAVRAGMGVSIRFVGIHDEATRARLAGFHARMGGAAEALVFAPKLTDAELAETYANALLVIAPSRAEGFSLPVIEAMAQGTPVLAADEPAQAELISDVRDRFAPDDAVLLRERALALIGDESAWCAAVARQAPVWRNFIQEPVAARFWAPVLALAAPKTPFVARGARPRIAVLSPLPPTPSGCADHSAALLASLVPHADITAFSATRAPVLPAGVGFGGRADAGVMRSPRYDAIIAVLGNSPFHAIETRLLLDYGAAAILHDARLIDLYRSFFGEGRARGVASAELGRDVTQAEIEAWTRNQAAMPARFIGEVAVCASPLIVHAAETTRFIAAHHGIAACFLPFAPYRLPDPARLTPAGRAAARTRLGVDSDTALIASFGHIHGDKDPGRMIAAFGGLGSRRSCHFALVGSGNPTLIAALHDQAKSLGIASGTLALDDAQVSEAVYRDYLAAADVAVQLRRAPPGSISGALMDAIAAGIPSVAASTLAEAIDPPDYVRAVADDADAGAIAAAIEAMLDGGRGAIAEARADFLDRRGMDRYASLLIEAVLG